MTYERTADPRWLRGVISDMDSKASGWVVAPGKSATWRGISKRTATRRYAAVLGCKATVRDVRSAARSLLEAVTP